MKRQRGNKNKKSKKLLKLSTDEPVEKVSSVNTNDNSGSANIDNDEADSGKEVESTTVVEEQSKKIADSSSNVVVNKPAGNLVYGRMRVKIKTPKVLDSQVTAADDTPTISDTDTSGLQVGAEKNERPSEKVEESENSLPDTNTTVSGNLPKKAGSIKIKSSRNLGSSIINPCTSALAQNEETRPKEHVNLGDPRSNDLELKAALEIIKKIMKMDAAEPFNAPVNPIALGIPDYFDVIDTPMDFGTICGNLESGDKYKNSEDVYKDVEYVWNNCYKYNKKGDYVVELMKRVKKNFTKYWMAAGLYCEQPQGSSGADGPLASNIKMQGKSGQHKKRHGVKRHKDDCLCAICVMMRRRQEREESLRREEKSHLVQDVKLEGLSPAESPYQDTSSNMENSTGPDADSDLEEKGEEENLDNTEQKYTPKQERVDSKYSGLEKLARDVGILGSSQLGESSGEKSGQFSAHRDDVMLIHSPAEQTKMLHDVRTATVEQIKRKGLIDKKERAKIFEKLQRFENPLLLELCETLFTDNVKSVWSGPHSLVSHWDNSRSSSIHEAISSFMK